MKRQNSLRLFDIKTYGLASSYDKILFDTMKKINESYLEGRVWDMERAIRSLIALLPKKVKHEAEMFFKEEYLMFKNNINRRLEKSLLPLFYEYREELLNRLIKVFSYIIDLLDSIGIVIHGYRSGGEIPEPTEVD